MMKLISSLSVCYRARSSSSKLDHGLSFVVVHLSIKVVYKKLNHPGLPTAFIYYIVIPVQNSWYASESNSGDGEILWNVEFKS